MDKTLKKRLEDIYEHMENLETFRGQYFDKLENVFGKNLQEL